MSTPPRLALKRCCSHYRWAETVDGVDYCVCDFARAVHMESRTQQESPHAASTAGVRLNVEGT